MPNLALIRNRTTHDCWDYYDSKTDIWIFGDVEGYRLLRTQLMKATRAKRNIHLDILEKNPNSMRSVILPAQQSKRKRALLKFVERFVWIDGNPHMELVIAGNVQGYKYLAKEVAGLTRKSRDDVSEHGHFDDSVSNSIVPRSVALNIRAPLRQWRIESYAEFSDLLQRRGEDFLPKDIMYRLETKEDYCEIVCGESDMLRL